MRLAAGFASNKELKQGFVLSSFIWIILKDFVLRNTGKAMGGNQMGRKNFPGLGLF